MVSTVLNHPRLRPALSCDRAGLKRGNQLTALVSSLCYFLLRRWWRVLRSNLRCFFFAIRLRRFLITEPMRPSDQMMLVGERGRHTDQLIKSAAQDTTQCSPLASATRLSENARETSSVPHCFLPANWRTLVAWEAGYQCSLG